MKTYRGCRTWRGPEVLVDGCALNRRLDLCNHSPTGFEWGYCGSGPAQLALAILAEHLADDQQALNLHQRFKWAVVARLPRRHWTLTGEEIDAVLRELHEHEAVAGGVT